MSTRFDRVDDVAHRLAHLLAAVEHEPVRENPSRQLDSGRHQKRRPVHGVEPDDVLADHVQIGGPVPPEQLGVGVGKADAGQVVGQRVDPDVHHVIGMVGDRHAPVERRAGDRQVAQTAGDEADHLVAPDVGPDELRGEPRSGPAACRRRPTAGRSRSAPRSTSPARRFRWRCGRRRRRRVVSASVKKRSSRTEYQPA